MYHEIEYQPPTTYLFLYLSNFHCPLIMNNAVFIVTDFRETRQSKIFILIYRFTITEYGALGNHGLCMRMDNVTAWSDFDCADRYAD